MADKKTLRDLMPKKIKVSAFDFDILEWDRNDAASRNRFGEFCALSGVIRIDTAISDKYKILDTLMHEIYHAIWFSYGIYDDDKEERVVSALSTAMVQVLRDNPDLRNFINHCLKEDDDA